MKTKLSKWLLCFLGLTLASCTKPTLPPALPTGVLVVSDSFAADRIWPDHLKALLGTNWWVDVDARVGATTRDMVAWVNRAKPHIDFMRYRYFVLQGGVNDAGSIDDTLHNLQYLVWVAHELNPRIKVVFVQYPEWSRYPGYTLERGEKLMCAMEQIRIEGKVDFFIQLRKDPKIGGAAYHGILPEDQSDGLHLTTAGKHKLAWNVWHTLTSGGGP